MSRVHCATLSLGYAKELELTYTEEELTEKLAEHFEKGVRHAFRGQQIRTKNALFQILADYDNDDKKIQARKIRSEDKTDNTDDERKESTSHNSSKQQKSNGDEANRSQYETRDQHNKPGQHKSVNVTQIHSKSEAKPCASSGNLK